MHHSSIARSRILLLAFAIASALPTACSSNDKSPIVTPTTHPDGGTHETPSGGLTLTVDGNDLNEPGAVTFRVAKDTNGIFQGYFEASTDPSTSPSMRLEIAASKPSLSVGSYPCKRASGSSSAETSILVKDWLDGHSYYTNVTSTPSCTIEVTAASETSVSISFSGAIVDQTDTDHPSVDFSGSFSAEVTN